MYELVPGDFEVPLGLEQPRFRLRMLSVDDVVKDFDAICDRVDREGRPQPPFVPRWPRASTYRASIVARGVRRST